VQQAGPEEMIARSRAEQAEKDRQSDIKLRKRWVRHGIAGAIVFFVLRGLLDFAAFFEPTAMLWNIVAAVVLGFPMGFLISRMNADRFKGMWVGGFTTMTILGGINLALNGEDFQLMVLGPCFVVGAFPGFAIGMHCELDR
jgi:fructose-1,6-bisphosphatase/inositol monophosphatase family enzyme